MDIQNLLGQCGVRTIPGFAVKIYAICSCDIETFPARKTSNGVGDKVTLDGNIVPKDGKVFAEWESVPDSGIFTPTEVGVVGSMNFQTTYQFKLAATKAVEEMLDQTPNGCWVVIVQDKDGNKRVIGSKDLPATRTAVAGTNGPDLASEKTYNITFTDNSGRIAPYYLGTIPTELEGGE
jgi:hypothetical protein